MSIMVAVYLEESLYWKIRGQKAKNNDPSLAEIARNLLKKYYLEKNNPKINTKGKENFKGNYERFNFIISDELNTRWEEKMALNNDKNKSKIMVEIFKKYYLKGEC